MPGRNHKKDPPPDISKSIPEIVFINFIKSHDEYKAHITAKTKNLKYILLNLLEMNFL